jgi:hypothetical protein
MTDLTYSRLVAAQTDALRLRSIVLLDWRDGPIDGIVKVEEPVSHWHFRLLAERPSADELDDRIYVFSLIPESAIEVIRSAAGSFGDKPLVWPYEKEDGHEDIATLVDSAIASANAPSLLVQSADFHEVKGVWRLANWPLRPQ